MASEQARRDNVVKEREVKVEKNKVPKMTSHFESMVESHKHPGHEEGEGTETKFVSLSEKQSHHIPVSDEDIKRTQMPHSVGKFVVSSGSKEGGQERSSLEDIHGYRANAQQKSMDAIRAVEERYNKAKQSHEETEKARHAQLLAAGGVAGKEGRGQEHTLGGGRSTTGGVAAERGRQTKESVGQGTQKAAAVKDTAMEKASEAKDTAAEKARRASEYMTEKGRETGTVAAEKGQVAKEQTMRAKDYTLQKAVEAKDIAAEKAQRAAEYMTEKGRETANIAAEKGQVAKEQTMRAKDYTVQKATEAKDTAAEKAQRASEYLTERGKETGNIAVQKGAEAKEQTASMAVKAKDYTVQKAVVVKDTAVDLSKKAAEYTKETAVEGGKGAAHYAGVAADKAAAVGWTAAHYTTEKVVQGTKAVAGTVEGVVEYTGQKAAEIGSKAVDLTKEKAAVAADTVVGYTARKKEEAQHGLEKKQEEQPYEGGEEEKRQGKTMSGIEYGEGRESYGTYESESYVPYESNEGVGAGGVLGAIGETIAEIAHTTKNIVIGDDPVKTQEHGSGEYTRREYEQR